MLALARSSSSCSSSPSSSNATACSSRSPTHSPQRPRFPPPTAPPCRSTNDRESKLDWSSRGRGALRCTPASRPRPTCRSPVQSLGRCLHRRPPPPAAAPPVLLLLRRRSPAADPCAASRRPPPRRPTARLHLPWPAPMKTAAAATTAPRSTVFRAPPAEHPSVRLRCVDSSPPPSPPGPLALTPCRGFGNV